MCEQDMTCDRTGLVILIHYTQVVDIICYRAENAYGMMSKKVDWRRSVLKERAK